jgi:hypothetical protein
MGKDRVEKGLGAGRTTKKCDRPTGQTLPLKILGFFPKFPYKLLNSLIPLILEIWKENFEKGQS